jgi:hypothetical protein
MIRGPKSCRFDITLKHKARLNFIHFSPVSKEKGNLYHR